MSVQESLAREGLVRPVSGRAFGGVCAGFARRYAMSPGAVRVLMVLAVVLIGWQVAVLYAVLWALMPDEATVAAPVMTAPVMAAPTMASPQG